MKFHISQLHLIHVGITANNGLIKDKPAIFINRWWVSRWPSGHLLIDRTDIWRSPNVFVTREIRRIWIFFGMEIARECIVIEPSTHIPLLFTHVTESDTSNWEIRIDFGLKINWLQSTLNIIYYFIIED